MYQKEILSVSEGVRGRSEGDAETVGAYRRGTVRCYYKCHYPQCAAKKLVSSSPWNTSPDVRTLTCRCGPQVEKHISDMDKVIEVKLEGTHNHPISDQEWEDSIKMTEEESGALQRGCGSRESSEVESKANVNVAVMA